MMVFRNQWLYRVLPVALALALLSSCAFHRKKYENPITKDTEQPDKILFDKSIKDVEKGRYEIARLTLQALINTYDSSEYLAKAKLAIADSWYREGGANGMAQAEAEYKDFILFYPTMEEAAEAQNRICGIHYKQMEKPDRDVNQAYRAEDECRQLLVQFPNSKFAPEAAQTLRNVQEVIAEAEFRVGKFYHDKGSNPAAANRLHSVVDQYPLYSRADEALFNAADSYSRMGPRFRKTAGEMYARIARDYPLSPLADLAKKQLADLEMPIPEPNPAAVARMKYEQEAYRRPSSIGMATGFLRSNPDTSRAAHTGTPAMENMQPTIPASIPTAASTANNSVQGTGTAGATGTTDVSVTQVGDSKALDEGQDARRSGGAAAPAAGQNEQLPTNRDEEIQRQKKKFEKQQKKKKKKDAKNGTAAQQEAQQQPAPAQPSETATEPKTNQ